jgi:hypothetical protein
MVRVTIEASAQIIRTSATPAIASRSNSRCETSISLAAQPHAYQAIARMIGASSATETAPPASGATQWMRTTPAIRTATNTTRQ